MATPRARPARALVITPFQIEGWHWLAKYFDAREFQWTFAGRDLLGRKRPFLLIHALQAVGLARSAEVVFSHGPYMTLYVALAMRLRRIRRPHIAVTFNHGNQRFFQNVHWAAARFLLQDVDLFVVHSQHERHLLAGMYGIPMSKMCFNHWAVQAPQVTGPLPDYLAALRPYVCCVGRNNRDFPLFLAAVAGVDINAIVVCRSGQVDLAQLPPNAVLKTDLPEEEARQVVAGSLASVVPLRDASTGAGHMTIVNAMLAGKAVILTKVDTVADYFKDGVHGRFVEPHSVDSLRQALTEIAANPHIAERWGKNAAEFAGRWLNEEAAARSLRAILDSFTRGEPYPLSPPGWKGIG